MKRRDVSPSSWLGAANRSPVPDLTFFADIQLNARVLLQIHAKAKLISIRQLPVANRYCMAAGLSETPNWYEHSVKNTERLR
jgi:hypothetical protein